MGSVGGKETVSGLMKGNFSMEDGEETFYLFIFCFIYIYITWWSVLVCVSNVGVSWTGITVDHMHLSVSF